MVVGHVNLEVAQGVEAAQLFLFALLKVVWECSA